MNFVEELKQLQLKTPRLYNINIGSENSDYCTHSDKNRNCYLVFAANFDEDCLYGGLILSSRDCVDCNYCDKSELCYECADIQHCYNCNYSQDLKDCTDCHFCYDCVGCKNCFGCAGLRQKEFYFFNEHLPKEKYQERVKEFGTEKESNMQKFEKLKLSIPRKASHIINSENCSGDYIADSKNCWMCFDTHYSQDCMYFKDAWRTKDSMDLTFSDGSELCYESFSVGLNSYNCNFCNFIRTCSDCEYCELCFSCKNCLGCIGLSNKQYYILNKPYSHDEYLKRALEITNGMRKDGSYGKFQLPSTYRFQDSAAAYMEK